MPEHFKASETRCAEGSTDVQVVQGPCFGADGSLRTNSTNALSRLSSAATSARASSFDRQRLRRLTSPLIALLHLTSFSGTQSVPVPEDRAFQYIEKTIADSSDGQGDGTMDRRLRRLSRPGGRWLPGNSNPLDRPSGLARLYGWSSLDFRGPFKDA